MIRKAMMAILVVLIPGMVSAREIAVCGESKGYSFYPELGLAPEYENKWTPDRVTDGHIKLVETPEGKFDLIYVNAAGANGSARNDGAIVEAVSPADESMGILVLYPDTGQAETYSFYLNASGNAEVIWTVNRWGPLVRKVSAFKSDCVFFSP